VPASVTIEIQPPEAVVIRPVGEIDYSAIPRLKDALASAASAGADDVIVDLSEVTFIDSGGLDVLLHAHQRQRNTGGGLVLRGVNATIKRLLAVTNLNSVFVVDNSFAADNAASNPEDGGEPGRTIYSSDRAEWRTRGRPF
jgi:stage II sporulation protein AA (anti-sigma F factor antagonist)